MTLSNTYIKTFIIAGLAAASLAGCKKFADVPPASNIINADAVYSNPSTIPNAISGLYIQAYIYGGAAYQVNLSVATGTSADELAFPATNISYEPFLSNAYTPQTSQVVDLWNQLYKEIYLDNKLMEGMNTYFPDLSLEVTRLAKGEALFMRAFSYFTLTQFFGDVPLALTSDANVNGQLSRSSKDAVMSQVIEDLNMAKSLLNDGYAASGAQRIRPNKAAASALLARVYLYTGQWSQAEAEATSVIGNNLYQLLPSADISKVFLKASQETIWQMNGSTAGSTIYNGYTSLAVTLVGSSTPALVMTDTLVNSFEPGDLRFTNWTRTIKHSGTGLTYRQPYKYKNTTLNTTSTAESLTYLRLAEQILIRAEARANQNNLSGAIADINLIRNRAGLVNTTASTKDQVLAAILQERKTELFVENGHRWFDLKRTGKINQALAIKQQWAPTKALFPIPGIEILNNQNLLPQNDGYN